MIIYKKGKGGYRWDFRRVTPEDIRYTKSKDNTKLYAIALGKPESGKSVMTALAKGQKIASKKISKVSLVSTGEEVKWEQTDKGLTVIYPSNGVSDIANAFKIEFKGGKLL